MAELKFNKMWEALVSVYDIDLGSVLPILKALPNAAGFADKEWFFYAKAGGPGGAYYEEGEMDKAKINGLKHFSDDTYVKNYFQEVKKMLDAESALLKRIESVDFTVMSSEDLKSLLQDSGDYVVTLFGLYLACQPQCLAYFEEKIQKELSAIVPKDAVIETFTLLSTPTAITSLRAEEIEWLDLLIQAQQKKLGSTDTEIAARLMEHYQKYRLLHLGDGATALTLEHFTKKFQVEINQLMNTLQDKQLELAGSLPKIEQLKKDAIKKYNLPDSIVKMGDVLAELGHMRLLMRIEGWMPIQYYNDFLAVEVGRRFGVAKDDILHATYKEVLSLFDGKKLDLEVLKDRQSSYLLAIENGEYCIYSGLESEKKFKQLVGQIDLKGVREFKGNIAMKGQVTGRVVVFRWGDDMEAKAALMQADSILIAGQTRPQLMPLILKSKAIVTDEGGITSHAAIVSRELGIPCIIGTKVATQVLKDGDMIEVDANKGIVRKL